ncbi:MAG: molybdenum cofactor guanylyltransferase [Promethearchaeati archaeon]
MEQKKYLAIIILIGGKSNRTGYEKGEFELDGKPLLLHQIETLSEFDEDVYLVANSEEQILKIKKKIEFPKEVEFVIDDRDFFPYPGIFTPMIGIYSGFHKLKNLQFKKTFLLSGDAPLIKSKVIKYMINNSEGFDCVIPRWENGFLETLFAIYPVTKTFENAKNIIKSQKHYALTKLIDEAWNINYISVEKELKEIDPNLLSLFNINGPIDIEKIKRVYKK